MSRPLFSSLLLLLAATALGQQSPEEPPLVPGAPRARTVEELAAQTVVVFNENDLDSTALAGLYVEKRGIPPKNLIGLRCSRSEEISRKEYDDTIAEPLRRELTDRGLWKILKEATPAGRVSETKVRFVALMHGVPLRVAETSGYEGDKTDGQPAEIFQRNGCSVDSELSILGLWTKQISGVLFNPYFREAKVVQDMEIPSQLLVTRLDGPSPAIVRQMIENTMTAEANGLRGFTYVDAQGLKPGALQLGDRWFHNAARGARERGEAVILDNGPVLFPDLYPMRHAAVYLGWYAEHAAGPFARENFRFVPGAIALHLHSFSAVTLRDRNRYWCGPLVAKGVAATVGNVAEPFLGLTPQPDIFAQRIREGFTFAEASFMSQRALSWMTTSVGDPLYRPYLNLKEDLNNPWDAYRAGVRAWLGKNRAAGEAALRESATRLKSGIVSEAMGLLEMSGNDHNAALQAFQQARSFYENPDDRARVALHESTAVSTIKGPNEAARFLREQAAANEASESAPLLGVMAKIYGGEPKPKAKPEPADPKKKR